MPQVSIEHSHISARNVRALEGFKTSPATFHKDLKNLRSIGIGLDEKNLTKLVTAMDSIQPTVTTGSVLTPVQFLQAFAPGYVYVATAARKIDEITGVTVLGSWADEQIVQGVFEPTGTAVPYQDYANSIYAGYNTNYVQRTIVRFEDGFQVDALEEERASRVQIDAGSSKRGSVALSLDITRNSIGFYGYNNGANNTYGLLNDPNLPGYVTVANGASASPLWSTKTFLEITRDIRSWVVALRTQTLDFVDPTTTDITMALATAVVDRLSTVSDFGISVQDWINKAYPRIRVVSAPELDAANGGANVAYFFAEKVMDGSTDDGRTFMQVVPMRNKLVGVQQLAKGYKEVYTNAMGGVMCKRPFAVFRASGL